MKHVYNSSKYVLLLILLIAPFLWCGYNEQSPFELIKMVSLCLFTLVSAILFVLNYLKKDVIFFHWNKALTLLLLITGATFWSYLYSNNQFNSFWGNNNIPSDSLLLMLIYTLFCFLMSQFIEDEKSLKNFNVTLLTSVFLLACYGVVQHFGGDPIDWWGYSMMRLNAYGTIGQAVGFASILGTVLPLAVVAYLAHDRISKRYLTVIFVMLSGIMYSGSRMPMVVTLALTLILAAIYIFKTKNKEALKKVGILVGVILVNQAVYYGEPNPTAMTHKLRPAVLNSGMQERIQVWEDAVKIWKKYPFLGTGPEHFALELKLVNTKDFNTNQNWGLYWHKAHNHLVHYLATVGSIGLFFHLLLSGFVFVWGLKIIFKKDFKNEDLIRLGYLSGYAFLFLANMTAFNFIMTHLYSFMMPTLFVLSDFKNKQKQIVLHMPRILNILNVALFCLLLGLFGYEIFRYWNADRYFSLSRRALEAERNMDKALTYIDYAIAEKDNDCRFYLRKASLLTSVFKYQARANPAMNTDQAVNELDAVTKRGIECDPKNPESWFYRARLFADLYESKIERTPERAERSFIEGQKFSPANPIFPYNLGLLYLVDNRQLAFVNRMLEAIDLKPDYMPPYQRLFDYFYQQKNQSSIDNLTQRIVDAPYISGDSLRELMGLIEMSKHYGDEKNMNKLLSVHFKWSEKFKKFSL